eukprot:CAMPEP_0197449096 /NCGR_PEP_ID=MMETSP1175-20131217/20136_1 /TAXON_ID=1003142 /ORGANISM="Triceratium dubium, Strain CCMP147" /LENGTH=292 /DNA_ID=CAMNT_0042981103 /DNA_START=121 /DNA_END=999 /DNA_ORIENTATION=-
MRTEQIPPLSFIPKGVEPPPAPEKKPRSIVARRASSDCATLTTRKKRVHFHAEPAPSSSGEGSFEEAEVRNGVRSQMMCLLKPSSEMSSAEKFDVWWQDSDFAHFQGTAQFISAEIRRQTSSSPQTSPAAKKPSYANVLGHALEACRQEADAVPLNRDDHEELSNPLPKRTQTYLTHWSMVGHSRRGLERWSVPTRMEHFKAHRISTIQAVLEAQDRVRLLASTSVPINDGDEVIGAASRRRSRSARMFALAMGMADAAAVGCVQVPTNCDTSNEIRHSKVSLCISSRGRAA